MTEERRLEMRQYREEAIRRQREMKEKRARQVEMVSNSSSPHTTKNEEVPSTTVSNTVQTQVPPANVGPVELAAVGLSKLQSRMQIMSPRLFRTPADSKSPLLKGLVFPDPLEKPQMFKPIRIPPRALEPAMQIKFNKVSAVVKGYLTRRLLNTEKVQIIVQTIRDTVDLILRLYEEAPGAGTGLAVKPQDSDLHQRLIQQVCWNI